jgi:tetratricopeptide (TPR) repeat protein
MTANGSLRTGLAWFGLCAAIVAARPLYADNAALGRKHAAKASQLASKNKCKGAVVEFSKAYKVLKDATLLFNRAECYRQMGKNDEALRDYEQFLTDMPTAPNRKNVEERIAALRATAKREVVAAPAAAPSLSAPAAPPVAPEEKEPVHRAEKWAD